MTDKQKIQMLVDALRQAIEPLQEFGTEELDYYQGVIDKAEEK